MSKGAVYFHLLFPFHDGQIGHKLFVVLNEPTAAEPYLVVKTTSNLRNRKYQTGCNTKWGEFFVPVSSGWLFEKDTVIQLIEIFEFSKEEFLKGTMTEKIISFKGDIDSLVFAQIVNCIRKLKEDISEKHFKMITR